MTDALPPLLIGEAPSKGGDRYHMFPLSGPPARVLCTLAGIPPQPEGSTYGRWTWALYEAFECRNLIERYRDADPWSVPRTRETAEALLPELPGRVVVMLGRRVQAAILGAHGVDGSDIPSFHEWNTPHLVVGEKPSFTVAIPHPSGLNRALNDPAERARCGETLREALEAVA